MGSYGMWDLGSGGPIQRWTYGVRDEDGDGWDPMGCGIWGRVAQRWTYGAQGWIGPYGMWDLGLGGPKMDIWDRDGIIWGSEMNGVLWDLRFGVGCPKMDIWDRDGRIWGSGMNGIP